MKSKLIPFIQAPLNTCSSQWSETINIFVGNEKKLFIAHRYVLIKLPFFAACLRVPMRENADSTINLPEDDPTHFQHIIRYAYDKTYVPRIAALLDANIESPALLTPNLNPKIIESIELYVTAEKIGGEGLCLNLLCESQFAIDGHHIDFGVINFAIKHLRRGDTLLVALLKEVAGEAKEQGWEQWQQRSTKEFDEFMGDAKNGLTLVEALIGKGHAVVQNAIPASYLPPGYLPPDTLRRAYSERPRVVGG